MKFELPDFEKLHVLVVGDVMLDRYWHGGTHRISPEAPVPVVAVRHSEERAGGAGNVALNLRALGCQVTLCSLVGDDQEAANLQGLLEEAGVHCHLERVAGVPTITKLRVVDKHQQLIRLDFEKKFHDQEAALQSLLRHYEKELAKADAIILSDYAKGTLEQVEKLIVLAKKHNIPVLVDPKNNDFTVYEQATLITPNLKEFEAVVGKCADQEMIEKKAQALLKKHHLTALLVTQSEQGMTLAEHDKKPVHLTARAREVYDVTGAGDTVIAVLGAALAAKEPMETAALLANIAAGIVIQKLGAASITVPELRRALQRHYASEFGVLNEEELLITIADARAHGEKIVMTNGCFDIIHPGHIAYLEEARALGDRLIVAVNDDASVARLKGPSRPVNSVENRMAVLSALRSVDWVVSFSEDTPARLIGAVLPDVLVKGGDYQAHEVAGGDAVVANGGEVKILQFLPGHSTANIIHKIEQTKKA